MTATTTISKFPFPPILTRSMGVWQTTYDNVHDSSRPATAVVRERDGMIDGSAHLLSSCRSTRGPTPLAMPHRSSEMREVIMLTVYLHVRQPYNVDGVTDHLPPPCPAVPTPRALYSRYSPFVHSGYVVLRCSLGWRHPGHVLTVAGEEAWTTLPRARCSICPVIPHVCLRTSILAAEARWVRKRSALVNE
jgi:hypothetical protein